jgi:hypothetical protein
MRRPTQAVLPSLIMAAALTLVHPPTAAQDRAAKAFAQGQQQARQELAAGKPIVLRSYGLPPPPAPAGSAEEAKHVLVVAALEKRHIRFESGRCSPPDDAQQDDGYRAEMEAEAVRRFGTSWFKDAIDEADARYAAAQSRPKKKG